MHDNKKRNIIWNFPKVTYLGGDSFWYGREKCARVVIATLAHIGSTMVHSAMRQ